MKQMMRKLQLIAGAALLPLAAQAGELTINGAGASFPAPVYQNWTYNYTQSQTQVRVNYQSVGSGSGIKQLKEKTVDFAGSDNPLTLEEQKANNFTQFPMLTGGVVVIFNVPGVQNNQLKLSRAALAKIFLGEIKKWNDPEIAAANPGLKLPNLRITVVRRADASGTSFIFTDFLSKISAKWAQQVGRGASVKWPVGLGGQKNPGVCNNVAKIRGSIGYTEYTYAVESRLSMAVLENADGRFVTPNPASFSAGAANADWGKAPGFYLILTDQKGADSWPIVGVTYILVRNDAALEVKNALRDYFDWCFNDGKKAALQLQYVPLPDVVTALIKKQVWNF